MNIPVVPISDKLIVLPISKQDVTLGSGLIVGESDLEKGEVVLVSKELSEIIKPGDIAYFPEKKPIGIMLNGTPHLWMSISDIWGIEVNEKAALDRGDSL